MKDYYSNQQKELAAAKESGDFEKISDIYRWNFYSLKSGADVSGFSADMFKGLRNAAKANPRAMQQGILNDILAFQGMLHHRVTEETMNAISNFDRSPPSYDTLGKLPKEITEVLLPRYARLTSEIFATIKTLKKLEAVSIPAKATTANEPADGAADDA